MIIKRKFFSYIGFSDLVPSEVNLSKELTLKLEDKTKLAKFLGKIKYIKRKQDKCVFYSININNKQLGDLSLYEENPRELEFEIVGVKDKKYIHLIVGWILNNAKDWGFLTVSSQFFPEEYSNDLNNLFSGLGFKEVKDPHVIIYEKRL